MSSIAEQEHIIRKTCRTFISINPLLPISEQQTQSSGRKTPRTDLTIDYAASPATPESDLKNALFRIVEQIKSPEHDFVSREAMCQVDTDVEFIRGNNATKDYVILYMHGGGL